MKTILITGAGGGMGQAACARFTALGWRVFALDIRRNPKTSAYRFLETDLTSAEAVEQAYRTVAAETAHLDCILHMAGLYHLDSLVEMDEASFRRIFDVNLFGVYRVNRTFLPLLSKGSRIIITSSELAPLDPLPFTGIYGISKAALEKYAYSLRMEVQLLGIRVSVIRPGAVDTGLLSVSTEKLRRFCEKTEHYRCNAERFRKIVETVEARKIPPEQIAALAAEAAVSPHPRYVYTVNRNPGLLLLNALPAHVQTGVIRIILKPRRTSSDQHIKSAPTADGKESL